MLKLFCVKDMSLRPGNFGMTEKDSLVDEINDNMMICKSKEDSLAQNYHGT